MPDTMAGNNEHKQNEVIKLFDFETINMEDKMEEFQDK